MDLPLAIGSTASGMTVLAPGSDAHKHGTTMTHNDGINASITSMFGDQDQQGQEDRKLNQEGPSHETDSGIHVQTFDDSLSNSISNTSLNLNLNLNHSTNLSSSELHTALPGGGAILKRGMACTFCRRRKLRCSAERPFCANCIRYSQTCEYLPVTVPRSSTSTLPFTSRHELIVDDSNENEDPPYTNIFTDSPLPPASDRPIPSSATERQRRRPSLAKPTGTSDSWNRRNSVHAMAQRTPTRDRRPSLARNSSASTSGPSLPLLSPTGPPSSLFTFDHPPHGHTSQTQSYAHEHGHGQPYSGPSTSTWGPRPALSSHDSGSILTSPSIHQPTPMGFHYEQVAPVPPPIQYPAEDETAWYQAALNVNPTQQSYPEYQQAPTQPQDHYVTTTPHYPAYEGYQDLTFGSTGVPGAGRYAEMDHIGQSSIPYGGSIYDSSANGNGPMDPSTSTTTNSNTNSYMHTPGPFDSQANLAIQTTPMTMPIHHTHYTTPSVSMEGHRPGMVHEGTYSGMGYQPLPLPLPVQEHSYMSPQQGHSMLYQDDHSHSHPPSNHQNQHNPSSLHHVQPTPYTFPHLPIPLPEYDRPIIPRSASNPTNAMHLSISETPSEGSISIPTNTTTTTTTTVSVSVPEGEYYPQNMNVMYPDSEKGSPKTSKVDKLSERLGEFFLGPEKKDENVSGVPEEEEVGGRHIKKSRKSVSGEGGMSYRMQESDGLTESARNALLDVFFEHHRLFFDFSIPRFKSRLTFHDRRRPSLALLNAMYMWATRMSHAPNMPSSETHFYQQAIVHLDASAATGDRLMDCIRAAYLLSAFQYMNGRHHSGYLLCGHSAQLVKSCGLHRIASTVFTPAPPFNPFLRNRPYLLPSPEDALELGERIHTFWAVFALDRSSSALTGFTSSFRDSDITTPWPRELSEIASGSVTAQDDVTVKDLYRAAYQHPNERSYVRWIKAVTILERASKLVLLDPEDSSEHTRQWTTYKATNQTEPPGYLESPRYRVPTEFEETKFALETLVRMCGDDGIFPVEKKLSAEMVGKGEVVISPAVILFHHVIAATQTLLYDTNSVDAENTEALVGARRAVSLIRELPPLPIHAVDAFAPLTWVMVAKVLIKEMRRLKQNGDGRWKSVEEEVQCLIDEINRVGTMMPPSRMYAKGVEDLLRYPSPSPPSASQASSSYSQLPLVSQSTTQSQSQPSIQNQNHSQLNHLDPTIPQHWDHYPSTNQSSGVNHDMS